MYTVNVSRCYLREPGSFVDGTTAEAFFFIMKLNRCTNFPNLLRHDNATCFGPFFCPSPGVISLYTRHRYMSHRFVDSFRAGLVQVCRQLLSKTSLFTVHSAMEYEYVIQVCRQLSSRTRTELSYRFVNILKSVWV